MLPLQSAATTEEEKNTVDNHIADCCEILKKDPCAANQLCCQTVRLIDLELVLRTDQISQGRERDRSTDRSTCSYVTVDSLALRRKEVTGIYLSAISKYHSIEREKERERERRDGRLVSSSSFFLLLP
jgi:hypothetical protein